MFKKILKAIPLMLLVTTTAFASPPYGDPEIVHLDDGSAACTYPYCSQDGKVKVVRLENGSAACIYQSASQGSGIKTVQLEDGSIACLYPYSSNTYLTGPCPIDEEVKTGIKHIAIEAKIIKLNKQGEKFLKTIRPQMKKDASFAMTVPYQFDDRKTNEIGTLTDRFDMDIIRGRNSHQSMKGDVPAMATIHGQSVAVGSFQDSSHIWVEFTESTKESVKLKFKIGKTQTLGNKEANGMSIPIMNVMFAEQEAETEMNGAIVIGNFETCGEQTKEKYIAVLNVSEVVNELKANNQRF